MSIKDDISKYKEFVTWERNLMDFFDDIIFFELEKDVNTFYRRTKEQSNGEG